MRSLVKPLLIVMMMSSSLMTAQRKPLDLPVGSEQSVYQRTRLILKNGSYQSVLSYKVVGDIVQYRSAERNGELEEIPLRLVDMAATVRWYHQHVQGVGSAEQDKSQPPVLSPELAKEEAARAALTPEAAPDLHLPEEVSVLALDTLGSLPELVPMPQEGSDLNKETAHAVQKLAINPASTAHRVLEIPGAGSDVQLHVAAPVFFVRVGEDSAEQGAGLVVDTHGSGGRDTPDGGSAGSGYVVELLDARQDTRIVDSFRIGLLNTGRKQPGIVEMRQEDLPGGHWMKLTPTQPLEPGEYALVEVVSDHEMNLDVWDFGVHPAAKEDVEAIRPEKKDPLTLKSRKPQD